MTARSGLGRVGKWDAGAHTIKTPNILFVTTDRFEPFLNAEILLTDKKSESPGKITKPIVLNLGSRFGLSALDNLQGDSSTLNADMIIPPNFGYPLSCKELHECATMVNVTSLEKQGTVSVIHGTQETISPDTINLDAELYVIGDAVERLNSPRAFIELIIKLREIIGYQKLIYAPGIGNPSTLAPLVYCSIDLFDSIQCVLNARAGFFLTSQGKYCAADLEERLCYCPACTNRNKRKSSHEDAPACGNHEGRNHEGSNHERMLEVDQELDQELGREYNFENLLSHSYYVMLTEIKNIRHIVLQDRLRDLVEARVLAEPKLVSILRLFDSVHYNFMERHIPIWRKTKLSVSSKESLTRPEVLRFQNRLVERYQKPSYAKILLLLPCSAKKPYSFSKSHKLFRNVILASSNPNIFHEVIITSPLGIVPRELELSYTAQQYDIPVTGIWDVQEIKIVQDMLRWLLENNNYDAIVSHLSIENEFISWVIEKYNDKVIYTAVEHPTSHKALKKLSEVLVEAGKKIDTVSKDKKLIEDMKIRARFQFGDAGTSLLKGATIKGRYPHLKIFYAGEQLGTLVGERGMISLTMAGGRLLSEHKAYYVMIEDFILKGNLFAVGVTDADLQIRIDDEVIIVDPDWELVGVGRAVMPPMEMISSNRGIAVKVRHKR